MLDSMIAARAQARLVQFYSPESQEVRLSRSETAGLPTGVARDLERLISERYATAAAAGNLAPLGGRADTGGAGRSGRAAGDVPGRRGAQRRSASKEGSLWCVGA
jgi:hypothetical protein